MAVASTQLIKQVEIGNNKGKGNIQNIFI
jgi:hypothetical protein